MYLHKYIPKPPSPFMAVLITEINEPFFSKKCRTNLKPWIGHYFEFNDDLDTWWTIVDSWPKEEFEANYVLDLQGSIRGSECKYCGKPYHACGNCDWYLDEWL